METVIAGPEHIHYAKTISLTIEESAKDRGTGIARRTPEYIIQKMQNGIVVEATLLAFQEVKQVWTIYFLFVQEIMIFQNVM